MLILKCKIQFTSKVTQKVVTFDYVNAVSIKTGILNLTDTATITLPRKISWRGAPLTDFITRGDSVSIALWYDSYPVTYAFYGFVTSVSSETPITIKCEDSMWSLKQTAVKPKRYPKFDLKVFISEYLPSLNAHIAEEASFGEVIIRSETTVAKVFDYLMKHYPIRLFFMDGELFGLLGTASLADRAKITTFEFGRNVIADKLTYTRAEDVKIHVIAKSILPDNTILQSVCPANKEGEARTLHNSSLKTQAELDAFAKQKHSDYCVDRCSGSFTAFGIPAVKKGDLVKIIDPIKQERNNKTFIIDGVDYSFSENGFRQEIHLGDQYTR